MKARHSLRSFLFGSSVAALVTAPCAYAVPMWWEGGTANWTSLTAWTTNDANTTSDPVAFPAGSDDLTFNRTGVNTANTVSLAGGNRAARSLTFNTSGTTVFRANASGTTTTRTLTLGTGGITLGSTSGNVTIGEAPGTYGAINIVLGSSQIWTNSSASTLTATGVVSGTNIQLTKAGSGTLTLSGSNTFSGDLIISAGRLNANNASALGTGKVDMTGASTTLSFGTGNGSVTTFANPINVTNTATGTSLIVATNAKVSLNAAITIAANTTIQGTGTDNQIGTTTLGTITSSNNSNLEIFVNNSQTHVFAGAISLGTGSVTRTANSNANLTLSNANNSFSGGLFIGSAGTGNGTSQSGATTITALGAQGSGDITFITGNTAPITFANVSGTVANNIVTTGGTGGLIKTGASTMTLTGTNTYTGTTTVSGGSLALGNNLALQNSALVTTGAGNVTLGAGITTPTIGGLSGATGDLATVISSGYGSVTALTLNPGTGSSFTYGGQIADGATGMTLTKSGAGTQVLGGTNNYTGGTTINTGGGTLRITAAGALGAGDVAIQTAGTNTGTLELALTGTNTIANTFNGFSSATALTGATPGVAQILNTSGSNTISSDLTVTGTGGSGLNIVSNGGLLTLSGTITSTVSAGARTLSLGGSGNGVVSGAINDDTVNGHSLSVIKSGSGTWTLSNPSNGFTGTTTVTEGTLIITGAVASTSVVVNGSLGGINTYTNATLSGSGSIDPGNSPGILTVAAINPTGGLDYNFEFTAANTEPTWSNAAASVNDVLRLTSATPFTASMDTTNQITLYLGVLSLSEGDVFTGGFFTDNSADFLASINSAAFSYFLADAGGLTTYNGNTYTEYTGPLGFSRSTVEVASADFAGGTVTNGYVTQFTVIPEPSAALLGGIGLLLLVRRRTRCD
jgi:autotransporter-associated beta strand protein